MGPGTIARHARRAILILTGAAKGPALRRILRARGYDPDWPASVVHACADAVIVADRAAEQG